MSSRARLLLLSGTGGAGTTTICAATVEALRDEGLTGVVVDATRQAPVHARASAWLGQSIGRLAADSGADPLHPALWTSLASVQQLSALLRAADALEAGDVDAVVVDCGDLDRARALLELPGILLALLDATLTPRFAMRRSLAPATGDAAAAGSEPTLFESWEAVREQVAALAEMLVDPQTTVRLIAVPEPTSVTRVLRAMSVFAALGVGVDGIIANRCARKSDDRSGDVLAGQDAQVGRLEQEASGAEVWRSTSRVRAVPKGRSALGPFGVTPVLADSTARITALDEEYVFDLPLVGPARREAQVGRLDDRLVVAFDGVHSWVTLPPVLRRCRVTHAVRTADGLRVSFVPDVSLWRRDPVGGAA